MAGPSHSPLPGREGKQLAAAQLELQLQRFIRNALHIRQVMPLDTSINGIRADRFRPGDAPSSGIDDGDNKRPIPAIGRHFELRCVQDRRPGPDSAGTAAPVVLVACKVIDIQVRQIEASLPPTGAYLR